MKADPEQGPEEEGAGPEWDGVGGLNTWSLLIPPRNLTPAMLLHSLAAGQPRHLTPAMLLHSLAAGQPRQRG